MYHLWGWIHQQNPKTYVGEKGMHSLLDSCEIRKDKIIEQRLKFAIQNNTAILVYKIKIKNEVWKHLKLILILFMNLNESIYVQVLKIVI